MNRELIGRDHAAATLRTAIDRSASHGGLVLVTGEAGIGKTTLITSAATTAREHDTLVLHGACWYSESAPGFWPWVQIVRTLRRELSESEWHAATRDSDTAIAKLLGEFSEPEKVEDFALFDAVATLLVAASRDRRVLVLLDDLHWADAASVRLLEFIAQHTWFERLLLVGAYRDVEVDATDHPLRSLLVSLAVKATTIALHGLDEAAVGQLMSRVVGTEPEGAAVSEIHRRTGGNPFFVEQAARLLDSGRDLSIADPGIGEAVRHRLNLLPSAVSHLLAEASVLGQRFHRRLLAALVGDATAHVDRLLEQAITARLMVSCGEGSFAFAHDLVRESLYETLSDQRRTELHAAVVTTVGDSPGLTQHLLPAELAAHAYRAIDHVGPEESVRLSRKAAEHATRRLATEEARGHILRALELIDQVTTASRVTERLRLGSLLRFEQDPAESWGVLHTAVADARRADDPALFARAAMTFYQSGGSQEYPRLKNDLMREAHSRLTGSRDQPSLERIQREMALRIAVIARRGNDDDALTFGLLARHFSLWGPGTAAERLAIMDEILTVSSRTLDPGTAHLSAAMRWVALLELDDPGYLEQWRAFVTMSTDGQPWSLFSSRVDSAVIEIQDGQFQAAEDHLLQVEADRPSSPDEHFGAITHHVWWALCLARGQFDEARFRISAAGRAGHSQPRLLEALTAIESGDVTTALRLAATLEIESGDFSRDISALWWRLQAEIAAATGDPRRCEQIRETLRPHLGDWLVSMFGCDVNGPATLWMGLVDAAEERFDSAEAHFTAAARSADRMRMRAWSLRARAGLGRCLLARDEAAGTAMLRELAAEAEALGMAPLAESARTATVNRTRGDDEFRRDGAVWNLRFGGKTLQLPDSKGLRDLHVLLSHPGTEIPALRLLRPDGGEVIAASQNLGADAVLDDEAKARFRQQIERLDAAIERAEHLGDDEKAIRYDTERQALLDQLRAATGLGGRDRRLGDDAERARKTVTARIKDAIRKIGKEHSALAEFLDEAVSTGIVCRYQPSRDQSWRL